MPTVIGAIFFSLGAYCFLAREELLFGLLILASIFEAASSLNIAGRGIQPYYLIAIFILARAALNRLYAPRPGPRMPEQKWLLSFGVIGVLSALLLPVLFAGTPVYDPKIGVDEGLLVQPPLHLGLNNLGQAIFLSLHLLTAFAILHIRTSPSRTRVIFLSAFYLVAAVIFAQAACIKLGLTFHDSFIRNNPGYAIAGVGLDPVQGSRSPGTFAEESFAGVCMVFYSVAFIAEYLGGKGSALRVLVSLAAIGMIASSGSLVALGISVAFLLLRFSPLRLPWHFHRAKLKRAGWILFLLIAPVCLVLVASESYRQMLITLTIGKSETGSFVNRAASDLFALQLLQHTRLLGTGLGSNRASSLLTTLLSTVGIAGTYVFGRFYFRLFRALPREKSWLAWGAFALLLNMCISVSDVTSPTVWIPILLAILIIADEVKSPAHFPSKGFTSLHGEFA